MGMNYIGHLTVYRRQTVQHIGGWRSVRGSASDHDLKLRIAEQVAPRAIIHLAKILIHLPPEQQAHSTAATADLLEDLIERRQYRAVVNTASTGQLRLRYLPPNSPPLVSLIIPTRDRADLLATCIRSILQHTMYRPFEIIVVDNGSRKAATHQLFEAFQAEPTIRILRNNGDFNFSALNNQAAKEARGGLLGFINNDVEVIDGGWLEEMVALAARPELGCVGAKLLYPDGRIQHAGVATGILGLAGHVYRFSSRDAPGYLNQLRHAREVSVVTAACLVVRKAVFDEVGGMDEKELKVAFNDVDFCLKVRAAGYRNVWTPHCELFHHELSSRGFDYSPDESQTIGN